MNFNEQNEFVITFISLFYNGYSIIPDQRSYSVSKTDELSHSQGLVSFAKDAHFLYLLLFVALWDGIGPNIWSFDVA